MSATWSSPLTTADLPLALSEGSYIIGVRAFDANGVVSSRAEATVTLVPGDLGDARVFPNPWRSDRHAGAPITFDRITPGAEVKIFTLSAHQVRTLPSPDAVAS